MPFVDLYQLLLIPHRLRLDLSVMLTASILYNIPAVVLNDTLMILYSKYMSLADLQSLGQLPLFARTALVSILRRICRRELDEINANGSIFPKPSKAESSSNTADPSKLTFIGVDGFHFLRPIKWYLHRPLDTTVAGVSRQQCTFDPFSESELEILNKLPDIVTLSSSTDSDDSSVSRSGSISSTTSSLNSDIPQYKHWRSYVARHTVLLLTKSPQCPPLTRAQTNKNSQDIYCEMLPLLKAAQMRLNDLDVELSGPDNDGRLIKLGTQKSLLFGAGLPRAGPTSLVWNTSRLEQYRVYEKPWVRADGISTFLTESKPRSSERKGREHVIREYSTSMPPLSPSFILSSGNTSRFGPAMEPAEQQLQQQLQQQELLKMQIELRHQQYDLGSSLLVPSFSRPNSSLLSRPSSPLITIVSPKNMPSSRPTSAPFNAMDDSPSTKVPNESTGSSNWIPQLQAIATASEGPGAPFLSVSPIHGFSAGNDYRDNLS